MIPKGTAIMSDNFLREAWYTAAMSSELDGGAHLSRLILGEPVLLFRDADGQPRALADICPHRFAPLSMGSVTNGVVTCPYRGLSFDGAGRCVHNPHGDGYLPANAPVRSYPVRESDGLIWVWTGQAQSEDCQIGAPPRLEFLAGAPETAIARGLFLSKGHYQLVIDNLMDLSHADYLHPQLLGTGGVVSRLAPKVTKDGHHVVCSWAWEDEQSMGLFAPFQHQGGAHSDGWLKVEWEAPARLAISAGASSRLAPERPELTIRSLHTLTPADAETTHYTFVTLRNWATADAEFSRINVCAVTNAFTQEDGPMIAAVQRNMRGREFWSLKPWVLAGDGGAVIVRRLLDRMVKEEMRASEPLESFSDQLV